MIPLFFIFISSTRQTQVVARTRAVLLAAGFCCFRCDPSQGRGKDISSRNGEIIKYAERTDIGEEDAGIRTNRTTSWCLDEFCAFGGKVF